MANHFTLPDSLAGPLRRLGNRYAESPIPGFLNWWGRSLRACLPEKWRDALVAEAAQLWIEHHEDALEVHRSDQQNSAPLLSQAVGEDAGVQLLASLGEADRQLPKSFLLPRRCVLQRNLRLPMAAADNLKSVVGFELDRQTPFKPDQVYYDCRIARRDAATKQIDVDLLLVPRPVLDAELLQLGKLATELDGVDVRSEVGSPMGCNLLPSERRAQRGHGVLWLNVGLVVTTIVFLSWAGSLSLDNRRAAVASLQEQVDAQRVEARRVNQLRERLDDAVEGANFLVKRREEDVPALDVLNEITQRLPLDTYLERLSLSKGKLSITGLSSHAAEQVQLLQKSPQIRSASLAGSIQPDARTGKERFSIVADYVIPEGGIVRDFPDLADRDKTQEQDAGKTDAADDAKSDPTAAHSKASRNKKAGGK